MAFTLKKVIDGQQKLFLIQKFLELLGDPTNDEIQLDGDAYRISSFINLDGSSSGSSGLTFLWFEVTLSVDAAGQQSITIPETINETNSLQLFINGIYYSYGLSQSYHILDTNLHWHGDFSLDPDDIIILKYRKSI